MKKFYPILIILIIVAGLLFYKEAKKTSNITIKHTGTPLVSATQVYIPIYKEDKMYGNPGADVTVITFTDFNCTKCAKIHKEIIEYIDKNPNKVRLVWKGLEQTKLFNKTYNKPHIASYCADLQNKFWPYVNKAMLDKNLTDSDLDRIATEVELNQNSYLTCKNIGSNPNTTTTAIAKQFGIKKLPVVFINNYYINMDEDISIKELVKNFVKE